MKRIYPFLLSTVITLYTAHAGPYGSTIDLGFSLPYFKYSEKFPLDETLELSDIDAVYGTLKSDEYGFSPRGRYGLTYRNPVSPLYLKGMWSYGKSTDTYDGSVQEGIAYDVDAYGDTSYTLVVSPYETDKKNAFSRFVLHAGYSFPIAAGFTITPYTGYERNVWVRSLEGMKETYQWIYLPLGILADIEVSPVLTFSPTVQVNIMTNGTMKVDMGLAEIFYDYVHIPSVTLGNKTGYAFSAPVSMGFVENRVRLTFRPWFEFREFGKSEIDTMYIATYTYDPWTGEEYIEEYIPFYEPASDNVEYGLDITLSLTFAGISDYFVYRRNTAHKQDRPALDKAPGSSDP